MNVISLFNGAIPLIALQVSAYKVGDDISLAFTKVIDRINPGTDEEDEYEVTDSNYSERQKALETRRIDKRMRRGCDGILQYFRDVSVC